MQSLAGIFSLELNTFETKMFDLGKTFTENVSAVAIDFAKKRITVKVKDAANGEVFQFLTKIAEDEKRQLRIKYGEPTAYTIEFTGTDVVSHTFDMGDAFEVRKTLASSAGFVGLTYNHTPMEHKIVFSFKDKIVKC